MSAPGFMTSAQVRDHALSFPSEPLSVSVINKIKSNYRDMKAFRSASPEFVECPRCREHHSEKSNYECICHRCRLTLLDDFPHHAFTIEMEKHDGWVRNKNT